MDQGAAILSEDGFFFYKTCHAEWQAHLCTRYPGTRPRRKALHPSVPPPCLRAFVSFTTVQSWHVPGQSRDCASAGGQSACRGCIFQIRDWKNHQNQTIGFPFL